ncbi:MAG TPA: archaemetzincin [Kofleriaceae bacterium]|nr:archaemetzincin [Kofleriaceae bacterium]
MDRDRLRLVVVALAALSATAMSACHEKAARRKPQDAGPPVEARVAAIGTVAKLSPELQRAFDPAVDFEPPLAPGEDDWLAAHPEPGQTYDQFVASDPNKPDAERRILYLLPLGRIDGDGAPALEPLVAVIHAFYGLEVKMLPAVTLEDVKPTTRVNDYTEKRQLLAPDVLHWMSWNVPKDAYGVVAITMEDLYPDPEWNFVFGQASLKERVGVQSFARYDPAFFGEARPSGWQALVLRRASWTMVHEIGHMFGLQHCVHYRCIMGGSNNQDESDRAPLHVCPVCAHKLWWALRYDAAAREDALATALRAAGFADEAAWSERRARWIRTGTR